MRVFQDALTVISLAQPHVEQVDELRAENTRQSPGLTEPPDNVMIRMNTVKATPQLVQIGDPMAKPKYSRRRAPVRTRKYSVKEATLVHPVTPSSTGSH